MADKIFCGNGKNFWFTNDQGRKTGQNIRVSIDLDKLETFFQAYGNTGKNNGVRYMNLEITSNKKGVDDYGNSHSVSINQWKPDNQQGGNNQNQNNSQNNQGGGYRPQQPAGQGNQQNSGGHESYTPPANGQGNDKYEDDIPF